MILMYSSWRSHKELGAHVLISIRGNVVGLAAALHMSVPFAGAHTPFQAALRSKTSLGPVPLFVPLAKMLHSEHGFRDQHGPSQPVQPLDQPSRYVDILFIIHTILKQIRQGIGKVGISLVSFNH